MSEDGSWDYDTLFAQILIDNVDKIIQSAYRQHEDGSNVVHSGQRIYGTPQRGNIVKKLPRRWP